MMDAASIQLRKVKALACGECQKESKKWAANCPSKAQKGRARQFPLSCHSPTQKHRRNHESHSQSHKINFAFRLQSAVAKDCFWQKNSDTDCGRSYHGFSRVDFDPWDAARYGCRRRSLQ